MTTSNTTHSHGLVPSGYRSPEMFGYHSSCCSQDCDHLINELQTLLNDTRKAAMDGTMKGSRIMQKEVRVHDNSPDYRPQGQV